MKIIISDTESYELGMPENISFEDFRILVKKLNVVVKFVDDKETSAKQIRSGGLARPRAQMVEIVKALLTLTPHTAEMDEALKKCNTTFQLSNPYKFKWIDKFKIKPEEVGVTEFPEKIFGRPFKKVETA
jgi:hypothetical protein